MVRLGLLLVGFQMGTMIGVVLVALLMVLILVGLVYTLVQRLKLPSAPTAQEAGGTPPGDEIDQTRTSDPVAPGTQPTVMTVGVSEAKPELAEPPAEPGQLERIAGIDRGVNQALREAGITSYHDLANTRVERLREILRNAHVIADPSTWPEQARLAAEGRWSELEAMQHGLHSGRQGG